jgi:alanyl-tRNA synthetase
MTGHELRDRFLRYFEQKGHAIVRSSPLVPANDPTLLFTNAGMVQFKAVFLGEDRRDYVRATTCQKCVRAGGKHNDLENVGRTARHHTFFEMLGNFSFGDYFKAEAIAHAWEFLTGDLRLAPARLCATVFTDDDEAFELWKGYLPADRILRLGEKDNFWAMGDTGPCGPCSEVHYHQGDHLPCAEETAGRRCLGPACECDRWLEIWNLVFMQFDRDASGRLTPLPKPSIDTGMGLERIAAVVQGRSSNFDTDLIRPLIADVERRSGKKYGAHEADDVSMRVIADHARATAFLIADGVLPSNEWRGYVLRRVMRRAMRHGRLLGLVEPFLWDVTGAVADLMGGVYPELVEHRNRVADVVRLEEERFAETLDRGLERIETEVGQSAGWPVLAEGGRRVPGRVLFTLYDTFGFPVDLAQEVLQDRGFALTPETQAEYEAEMEAQRERARAGASFGAGGGTGDGAATYQTLLADIPKGEFLGYEAMAAPARILAMMAGGRRRREAVAGDEVEVILDRTPFYAESGGQIGDTGVLTGRQGRGEVVDTQYRGAGLIAHRLQVKEGGFREGEDIAVQVESPRRQGLRLHHTGTHLLHAALRKVLGTHVTQAGSLVAPDHLRFDFTHGKPVKDRDLERVEDLVNEAVRDNIAVDPFWTDLNAALRMGAMALFGEKYGDHVRVIRIGDFSTELCGGTHLDSTGQIGLFKVMTEGAVASGVRRLEAVTGSAALAHVGQEEQALRQAADLLRIPPLELPRRLQKLLDDQKGLERQIAELETRLAKDRAQDLVAGARAVAGVSVVVARLDGLEAEGLRAVVDSVRDRLGSGVIVLGAVSEGKVSLVSAVTKDLTSRFHAGRLVQEVAKAVGGGGGGRPDLAQAGGKNPAELDRALAGVYDSVARAANGA